jgi:hypothetical protein
MELVVLDLNLGIILARQELYYLNHASSTFCSGYFGDRVLLFCLSQRGLRSSIF